MTHERGEGMIRGRGRGTNTETGGEMVPGKGGGEIQWKDVGGLILVTGGGMILERGGEETGVDHGTGGIGIDRGTGETGIDHETEAVHRTEGTREIGVDRGTRETGVDHEAEAVHGTEGTREIGVAHGTGETEVDHVIGGTGETEVDHETGEIGGTGVDHGIGQREGKAPQGTGTEAAAWIGVILENEAVLGRGEEHRGMPPGREDDRAHAIGDQGRGRQKFMSAVLLHLNTTHAWGGYFPMKPHTCWWWLYTNTLLTALLSLPPV